jgi:hypothetical protein
MCPGGRGAQRRSATNDRFRPSSARPCAGLPCDLTNLPEAGSVGCRRPLTRPSVGEERSSRILRHSDARLPGARDGRVAPTCSQVPPAGRAAGDKTRISRCLHAHPDRQRRDGDP